MTTTASSLLRVTEIPTGAVITYESSFGTNELVKLGNDEFSGIPDRPIAYFTFADARGISRQDFLDSMNGVIGYRSGVIAIWQQYVDTEFVKITLKA
jgi:hypothetical protein